MTAVRTVSRGSISRATRWTCPACTRDVTTSDWGINHTPTGRTWHADCWHAHEAPGQGDLLDVLAVTR